MITTIIIAIITAGFFYTAGFYLGYNQVSKDKWKSNDAWALGLNFEDEVNLTNNRFTLNVRTNATNINTYPYDVYMYFFSRREI